MPANLIEAKDLCKAYGGFQAVDGVDFAVRAGECFGFLGPNGAGKSTLMKMIYCFSPRSSGDLSVLGLDPDRSPAPLKNRLGVVAQSDNLDDEITVLENLKVYSGYFGLPRRQAAAKIAELLGFMSLTEKAAARIRELSGGMKRRLVIARALLNDPDLLILDEPTTGLDPQVRHLIWVKLRELKRRGVTLLLTTHYMEEAQQLCDRLLVMDRGKVLAQGRPRGLVKKYLPPYVLELPAAKRPARVPAGVRIEKYQDRVFLYSASPASLHRAAGTVRGHFQIRPTGLEDLFLKLTGRDLHESE
ncbi:MAG TPA: ABC transporter ATP-binding protein [bacterium]|nr:ABC transporter ATP-binding protein [bacterium]